MPQHIGGYRIYTPADEWVSHLNRIGECPTWLLIEILETGEHQRYWDWKEGNRSPSGDPTIAHNLKILGELEVPKGLTERIEIRLRPQTFDELKALSEAINCSMSELVRAALEDKLDARVVAAIRVVEPQGTDPRLEGYDPSLPGFTEEEEIAELTRAFESELARAREANEFTGHLE